MTEVAQRSNEHWYARAGQAVLQSRYIAPEVLARGSGARVWDVAGREYLDFESGQVCMSLGHSNNAITEVVASQAGKLMQTGSNFTTPEEVELAEVLRNLTDQEDARVYLASTGSESNEVAFRIAKKATGRDELVGVQGGYHGLTHASWSLSTHMPGALAGYGPRMANVSYIPMPDTFRCSLEHEHTSCALALLDAAEQQIDYLTSGKIAAIVCEIVMSPGGVITPPKEWFHGIRSICDERGALMIVDEAQTAMGRTGKWFAYQHMGVVPDIVTTSKALGGGVALSAVITTGEVAERAVDNGFTQTSSHVGDPFAAAVGLANIREIERGGLLARASEIGEAISDSMRGVAEKCLIVGDVRGLGSIYGIDIVYPGTRSRAPDIAADIFHRSRERGVIVSLRPGKGDTRNVIRLIPPLIISDEELQYGLSTLADVIAEVSEEQ